MVPFSFGLVIGYNDAQMEFIFFALNYFSDSFSHLTDKIYVKLAVELVTFVLFKTLDDFTFPKVFSYNSHYGFFHFLFKNVIFTFCVYFVQKLLFAFFVGLVRLLLGHCNFSLVF
jgi:hypothetical protein